MRKSIAQILKLDTTTSLAFSVSYTDEENVTHNYSVFTNDQFRQIAKQMFGKRVYDDWDDESTDNQFVADFLASFGAWKGIRQDTYGRRMFALDQKFNPLENYRAHEHREGEVEHGEQVDLTFDGRKDKHTDDSYVEKSYTNYKETEKDDSSVTRSYTNYQETLGNAQQTHTHNISADDSNGFVAQSQDIDGAHDDTKSIAGSYKDTNGFTQGDVKTIEGSVKDQRGFTQGAIDSKEGKETTTHSGTDTDEYTLDRYGNIGVTTSQQMLASDLDLLRYDITMTAIKEFIGQYTFISEEVD